MQRFAMICGVMLTLGANMSCQSFDTKKEDRELLLLRQQVMMLKTENAGLKDKNRTIDEHAKVVKEIPADFRIGKDIAYFSSGSAVLNVRYRSEIEQLGALLKDNPSLHVRLEGYADPRGSVGLNQKLAKQRLNAVAGVLKSQGVEKRRIKLETVGATADAKQARVSQQGELQLDRKVRATLTSITH